MARAGAAPRQTWAFSPDGESAPTPAAPIAPAKGHFGLAPPTGLLDCTACSARADALRVVPGEGPADAAILFLGQSPGEDDDYAGRPFVGLPGVELDIWLRILGVDRKKVFITNTLKCHTANNRPPRVTEVRACSNQWLLAEWHALPQVEVVVPLDKSAVDRVLGKSAPPMTPPALYHYKVRMLGREVSVFPLPHPAFFLRAPHYSAMFHDVLLPQVRETWEQLCASAYARSRVDG